MLLFLLIAGGCAPQTGPVVPPGAVPTSAASIRTGSDGGPETRWFELLLDPADMAVLAAAEIAPEDWSRFFRITVVTASTDAGGSPPVLGEYRIVDGVVRFEPRFPLLPGVRYRAEFDPKGLAHWVHASADKYRSAEILVDLPRPTTQSTTFVASVFPTASKVPENQLKFYIHFSAPMSRGEAYLHVHLLNEAGREVELPFLDLHEELWDRDARRFTLFFDPGRIKRGLKPREEAGPALEEGKRYRFVVDESWRDSQGNPLKASFSKSFEVGPPDDVPPDPKAWKLAAPRTMTREPLTVRFPKPMDHAMLERVLHVQRESGAEVSGTIEIGEKEMAWRFTPAQPWLPGTYQLVVATVLEDLAGNSIGKPFEIDVFRPVQQKVEQETIGLPFRVQ